MIKYVYSRVLCRKAVARTLKGKMLRGKSGNHEFPVCIKIEPRRSVPSLYVCLRNRRDAHTQDDAQCACRKKVAHHDEAYAFIVPFEPNKEDD